MEKEEWRDVVGFEGFYMVSNLGRVKSLDRYVRTKGAALRLARGRVLHLYRDVAGYSVLTLFSGRRSERVYAHILVAAAFIGPRVGKKHIDHIDRDKTNNKVSNLRYVSSSINALNSARCEHSSSRFVGVCFDKHANKWKATAYHSGRNYHLGNYVDEIDAARAYDRYVLKNNLERPVNHA